MFTSFFRRGAGGRDNKSGQKIQVRGSGLGHAPGAEGLGAPCIQQVALNRWVSPMPWTTITEPTKIIVVVVRNRRLIGAL